MYHITLSLPEKTRVIDLIWIRLRLGAKVISIKQASEAERDALEQVA